uniref:ATP synthase F0 subunit 8 n=1 Tax=Brachytarsina amboinensis TaxID=3018683 RepID=UPI0023AAC5A3|nr:ATP synthase F0 subunit 8 [Brachytarsina amboinensis]WCL18787.1 ATP synthase F0 subunit 8 [Brachytarsina amboinensis]WHN64462.1 ATP synthase F0 subunit 8 [Brachytarsina amboinensis]
MPQMSPMNWLLLYIYFLTIFFLFMMMNYFSYNPKMPNLYMTKKKKSMNWKW